LQTPAGEAYIARSSTLAQQGMAMAEQVLPQAMPNIMREFAQVLRSGNVQITGDPALDERFIDGLLGNAN
jgi:hypothetical protein